MYTDPQNRMRVIAARREVARLRAQAEAVTDRMAGPCCRDGSAERHRLLLAAAITESRARALEGGPDCYPNCYRTG